MLSEGMAWLGLIAQHEHPMIVFDQVSHFTKGSVGGGRAVLSSADLTIPESRRVALMGEPFEHTRTVIDLAAGSIAPGLGRVMRTSRVSFPAGETRMFISEISVRDNVKHIARLYAADHRVVVRFVQDAMDIGPDFDKPYGSLSRDLRKSFSHIVAYSIPFQVYVLIETLKSGKGGLIEVARQLLKARTETSGLIAPTRDMAFAAEFCDSAVVLRHNRLYPFDTIADAVSATREADRAPARARQG
jgi:capsular polysaccharide transport system ATP-binding protein